MGIQLSSPHLTESIQRMRRETGGVDSAVSGDNWASEMKKEGKPSLAPPGAEGRGQQLIAAGNASTNAC